MTLFGILKLVGDELDNFIIEFKNFIKVNNYECLMGNKSLLETDCIKYIKKKKPNWYNSIVYYENNENNENSENSESELKNIKIYNVVFKRISQYIFYYEINGGLNLNNILSNYNVEKFDYKEWNNYIYKKKSFIDNINKYITDKYITFEYDELKKNTNNNIELFKKYTGCKINNNILLNLYKFNKFNNNIDNIQEIFNSIKVLDDKYKLPPYINDDCININNKNSENVYNSNVCVNNDNYILLDCKCYNGCEIADIYDYKNNILFHNKKKEADLRVLTSQVTSGLTILQDKDAKKMFEEITKVENFKILDNYKYVLGIIICDKDVKKINNDENIISLKDMIQISLAKILFDYHKVELLINYIERI